MSPRPEAIGERVLVLAPTGQDARLTASVLSDAGIGSLVCRDAPAVARELAAGDVGVVLLAEEALTADALAVLLSALAEQPPWSDVPLVVIASEDASVSASRRSLEIVDLLGHVTLLDRPIRLISLLSAIRVAIRARRRQYQARELLVRLQQGLQQRDQFLAMLGHELRNPLTAITYAAARLRGDSAPRHREVIERQSWHLARIVDELLDVARVTTNKVTLHRAVGDLRELVASCVDAARLGNPELDLQCELSATEVPVDIDAVRMEQVVTNLLVNAVKYTSRAGVIRASLRKEAEEAVLSVEDNGVGISADMLPRIFDLFTQVDGSLDRARGGLGIGLTVVRGIVELHGGTVEAFSEGLDRGSRFDIRLPLAASVEAASPAARPPAAAELGRGRRVLIVEDDADIRDTLREALECVGHVVDAAADGVAAIAQAHVVTPEVALVDIGLHGMTGYELARALRNEFGVQIYLAAMTGYGLPEDRQKAREAGFDTHLTKPVSLESVDRLVRGAPDRETRHA
jgi:signal transduction histidine kinase/ActR/RegA family two-component response regulator